MPDIIIYDKAKYHYEGDFPPDLDRRQAYVHIGMFFGWLCHVKLVSLEMCEDFGDEIDGFKRREILGSELMMICGGVLSSDLLNQVGNDFAQWYYDDVYLDDYVELLVVNASSVYRVEDSWRNFDIISQRMTLRFQEWNISGQS